MSLLRSNRTGQRDRVRRAAEALRAALPEALSEGTPRQSGGVLSKVALFRELLMHRVCECADAAILLGETHRRIPALLLSRAVAESIVMLCWLHQKLAEFITTKDQGALERLLTNGTFGNSCSTALDQACNVLMVVDRLDKEEQGFKQVFNAVCEFTEPNYASALGTFGQIDANRNAVHRGETLSDRLDDRAVNLLMICLKLARSYSDRISVLLAVTEAKADRSCDRVCEQKIEKHSGEGDRI